MKKLKLLFAICALMVGGVSVVQAQWTDCTSAITNPSFETDDAIADLKGCGWATNRVTGWTIAPTSASNSQVGIGNSSSTIQGIASTFSPSDGDKYFYMRENWNPNETFSISQTINSNIPAGIYRLTVKAAMFSSVASTYTLSLQEKDQTAATNSYSYAGTANSESWRDWSVMLIKRADDTDLTITAAYKTPSENSGGKHYCLLLDDVKLEYLAPTSVSSTNTFDMTSWIVNPSFELNTFNGTQADGSSIGSSGGTINKPTGWTCFFNVEGWRDCSSNTTAPADGTYCMNAWFGTIREMKFYQTINYLPEGVYEISAQVRTDQTSTNGIYTYGIAGGNTYQSDPWDASKMAGTWNSMENWQTLTARASIIGGGSLQFGLRSDKFVQFDDFHLTYLGSDLLLTELKNSFSTKQSTANSLLSNSTYDNVIGAERSTLTTKKGVVPEETVAGWTTAVNELQEAIDAFIAAKTNYDALAAEIIYAKSIGIAANTADGYVATSSSTAATALTSMQNLKVAEYSFITTTYSEPGTLSSWTENFAEDLDGEGYVASGDKYWNEWGTNTRTAKQTVTLPAGSYAISCIGRGAVGTSGYLYYKVGEAEAVTVDFLMKGNRGRGVDTNGEANFSDQGTYTCNNEGFGWEYRFLTFTLAEETNVEIGVSATFASSWVSIYAPKLHTTEATIKALRLAEIAEALKNVPTGNMNATVKSTLDSKKAAAQAASQNNTKDELVTILSELNAAIAAAETSVAEYTIISDYLTTSSTNVPGDYSTISTAITAGSYENSVDGMAAIKTLRNSIATTGMAEGKDLTALIDNNSFETGNTKYWSVGASSDTGARDATNATYSMSNSDGNYVFNTWWQGIPITQNIGMLPSGAYQLKGVVASDGGTIYITMNDKHEAYVETAEAKGIGIEFAYTFTLDANQEVTIGLVGGDEGTAGAHKNYKAEGYWFYKADNFRLTYMGATAPENTLDGSYYLSTGGNKIARGGDSGTEAVMNTEGIPVVITTDKAGISKLQMGDTEKYLMWNNQMVYTDGTIEPAKTHHQPYWKVTAVEGGYQILNTESGKYLTTATATRDGKELTVATCSDTPAVWTLTAKTMIQHLLDQITGALATVPTGKMNATVQSTLNQKVSAAQAATANNTKAELENILSELTAAIEAANASIAAYIKAKQAIDDATALKTNHNFASATAITTFAEAIAAIETPYNNNTLTTADAAAAGTTLGVAISEWRANPNGAAVKYLNDGFGLNDFDANLYVNTWSNEGESDGSNFTVPFYEYWTGDASSLAQRTWTGTLTDLPNGQYKISTWVRVRAKNETAAADATGITIAVNDGEAVDVTEGTQIGESQFQIATYEALGLVKDGTLNFNVIIADGNNISWLSFKNVKYTKVRDLTPDEAAVKPTAIALDPTTVTLNATSNTATLTPTFTPQDATQTVTWTSSDEGVATVNNGVVTGVAPGTATITVTSTLDENVKATATVTVSYPETVYETSSYTNDGATRTIYALGENIIKNGSFEYPNGYYGWKNGAGGDLAAANFDIVTEEDNKYLKAKNSEGAGSANSISTAWPIEAGKTYVFGYKVKASTTVGDKSKYLVVSMTNTPGTETKKVSKDDETVNEEWNSIKYEFTNTEGYAYVQFRARWLANSLSFDDFYLAEATTTTVGNVEYATAAIPTANIGTGAFQYSQDAIDAANALVQGMATVDDVEAAYNALQAINAPTDNQVFNIIMGTLTWTNNNNATMLATEGKAATYLAGDRTDQGLYNIKYSVEPNVNCAQAFKFTPVEGTVNGFKLSQIDADGNQRYICTVTGGGYANNNTSGIRTTTDASKALTVIVIPTTEGVYNLRNTEANALLGAQDAGFFTYTGRNNNLIIRETSKPSITINTTAAGWGTTILPFAVTSLPEGVKVYTISESNGNALTMVEHDAIEANKPYVIEGAWSETLTGDAQGTALTNQFGLLVGTYTRIPAPDGSYILQKQGDKVGFFKVDTSVAEPNVPANRAYLSEEASSVRGFLLDDSEVITAINAVKALTEGEALIYDMNGVQQPRLKKGMNIIRTKDGRTQKVMVR